MTRRMWAWARPVGGALVLGFVVWRLGAGPLLDGVRTISARSVVAAVGITAVTTVCSAWRWTLVARPLGVDIALPTAVAEYYRSQFLNTVLPGGVLGAVHRGIRHGRDISNVGCALRAVGWERLAGQIVQVGLAFVVLLALPSPLRSSLWHVLPLVVVCALSAVVLIRLGPRRVGRSGWTRTLSSDIRNALLARWAWPRITIASGLVVAGHAAIFMIAARTAGLTASPAKVVPLVMLVLLAMGVPANIAGWGPREGVAAWAFSAAGLGAAHGVVAATVYGVLVFLSCLPGVAVLIVARRRRGHELADSTPQGPLPRGTTEIRRPSPVVAGGPKGALHG